MGAVCSKSATPINNTAPLRSLGSSGSSDGNAAANNANQQPQKDANSNVLMQKSAEILSPSEEIRKKAEEFWNEIKDIKLPDVTSGEILY